LKYVEKLRKNLLKFVNDLIDILIYLEHDL